MKKFTKLLTEIILANTRGRLLPESMAGMEIICQPNVTKQIIQPALDPQLMTSFESFDRQCSQSVY